MYTCNFILFQRGLITANEKRAEGNDVMCVHSFPENHANSFQIAFVWCRFMWWWVLGFIFVPSPFVITVSNTSLNLFIYLHSFPLLIPVLTWPCAGLWSNIVIGQESGLASSLVCISFILCSCFRSNSMKARHKGSKYRTGQRSRRESSTLNHVKMSGEDESLSAANPW